MAWRVEEHRGRAAEQLGAPEATERTVRVLDITRPAVVLGSAQRETDADAVAAARAGVDVVRRRSGGGAVLVAPGETLWVDVSIPAGDPLWDIDVGRAFRWLGRAWSDAVGRLGLDAVWHDGPMRKTEWSPMVCFAGLGPGEVLVNGRKVVGMSQRRTRGAALFQCCALLRWNPTALLAVLALDGEDRQRAAAAVHGIGLGVGSERQDDLLSAFLDVMEAV